MGVKLTGNPLAWLGVVLFIFLGAIFFSSLSLLTAALVRTRERVQGLGQLIMMPLFFASNALYPVTVMPAYVEVLARINPLSYMVDGLRELMVSTPGHFGLGVNLAVLVIVNIVMVWLAARIFPRVVQ
jgi:ABC-2 type transport system permease protein